MKYLNFRVYHKKARWPAASQIRAEKGWGLTARRGEGGGRRSRRKNQEKGRRPGTEDQSPGRGGLKTGVEGEKQCQYTGATKTLTILDDDQVARSHQRRRG